MHQGVFIRDIQIRNDILRMSSFQANLFRAYKYQEKANKIEIYGSKISRNNFQKSRTLTFW